MTEPNDIIAKYTLNDQPLFPADLKGSAEYRFPNGTVIHAVVEGDELLGYTAKDVQGKELHVTRMFLRDEEAVTASGPIRCYYCICDPVCHCWPEPCPIV